MNARREQPPAQLGAQTRGCSPQVLVRGRSRRGERHAVRVTARSATAPAASRLVTPSGEPGCGAALGRTPPWRPRPSVSWSAQKPRREAREWGVLPRRGWTPPGGPAVPAGRRRVRGRYVPRPLPGWRLHLSRSPVVSRTSIRVARAATVAARWAGGQQVRGAQQRTQGIGHGSGLVRRGRVAQTPTRPGGHPGARMPALLLAVLWPCGAERNGLAHQ
jgi:hypothetical protein